jgi:hypothetical protein
LGKAGLQQIGAEAPLDGVRGKIPGKTEAEKIPTAAPRVNPRPVFTFFDKDMAPR